jgi:DNA-binding MarR family transcriptional regulator
MHIQLHEKELEMAAKTKIRTEDLIARECLVVRLRLLNRVVTNIYDDALRPLGVKASQLNILVVAAKLGLARPADVCKRLQLDTSTLSRNVDRMRAKDWLEVVSDDDGRAQPFQLTAKGRRLLDRALPAWEEAQAKVKKLIGADVVASIDDAVKRIRSDQANK